MNGKVASSSLEDGVFLRARETMAIYEKRSW